MAFRRRRTHKDVGGNEDQVAPLAGPPVSEAAARKQRSEATIRALGVPINDHLPLIESEADSTRREVTDVAERAFALMAVAVKGEGHSVESPEAVREYISAVIEEYRLDGCFTPHEQTFIDADEPDRSDWVQFTWRYECCWVMHWALGFVDHLGPPTAPCDAATTVRQIHDRGREGYIAEARLRPLGEILDEADLAYRFHWAVRNARLRGHRVEGIDPGVVIERHYALNWLIGYAGQEWDDISTDT